MPVTIERFLKHLEDSGVLSPNDLSTMSSGISPEKLAEDAQELARTLVLQNKLTLFQANALYAGKPRGLCLGNYVILDRIGAGGMALVFKAEHRRMKRVVAIKVLPPAATSDPSMIERFHREVQAAARLSHPNIVAAHDAGEHEGIHFLVMEYVDGVDLGAYVAERGPLNATQALNCILQAARGLEYAHSQGVIHRDIKPSNLLLTRQGMVKILDMGLARLDDSPGTTAATPETTGLTQAGSILGTVDFMAPEQVLDCTEADARSDCYSLGCTLWYLMTGQPIHSAETVMKRIVAHREAPIPSLRTTRPEVPPQIDRIFQRMVAKAPVDRYPSMSAFIAELSRWKGVPSGSQERPPAATASPESSLINAIFED